MMILDAALVGDLWNLSPLFGVLVAGIYWLATQLKKKNDEVVDLNQHIRSSEKENLMTLKEVSDTLDRVIETQKSGDNIVLKEIDNLKQILLVKLKKDD